jgi:hypothetical protein
MNVKPAAITAVTITVIAVSTVVYLSAKATMFPLGEGESPLGAVD